MSATFTGGVNWQQTNPEATLTASLLVTYIEGTVISNVGSAEFADGAQPMFVGPSAPSSPPIGLRWRDTFFQMTHLYDGTRFQPESQGRFLLNSGATLPLGSVVVFGATFSSISRCETLRHGGVVGMTATMIGTNMLGLVRTDGVGSCLVTGTCTAGDVMLSFGVGTPSLGGALQSVTTIGGSAYQGGGNLSGQEVAIAMANNGGVAGTVTCLVIR